MSPAQWSNEKRRTAQGDGEKLSNLFKPKGNKGPKRVVVFEKKPVFKK